MDHTLNGKVLEGKFTSILLGIHSAACNITANSVLVFVLTDQEI